MNDSASSAETAAAAAESQHSVLVPSNAGFFRKLLAYTGPGFLVAVGYMDPGNWATAIAGGSKYNYTLLSVVLISNVMAMLLQTLCIRLGIATGRDLAQSCRSAYSQRTVIAHWIGAEIAIAACDLAEVIGTAVALNLLFHIPLLLGACITVGDVLLMLLLQNKGFRALEALVITLIATVGGCFALEMFFAKPDYMEVAAGFIPQAQVVLDPGMLYLAIGIIGATVMPHNLYMHSSIVQTRKYEMTPAGKREAIKFATIDSTVALTLALFINAAILIVSAATFFRAGRTDIAAIEDAYKLLTPMLGTAGASTLFALALLASGQNSTLTGTLAGQIVMEGFLEWRIRPWLRRLLTRLVAVVPTVFVILFFGEKGVTELLLFSQVILSMQLSFAVFPLVMFTSDKLKMGEFVNPRWMKICAWIIAIIIAVLNVWLLLETLKEWIGK